MTKITIDRAVLEQALEFCESVHGGCTDSDDGTVEALTVWCPELIDDLRAALAQAEPASAVDAAMNKETKNAD